MKVTKLTISTQTPKGVRLQWKPLNEVKPVKLSSSLTMGKFVSEKELTNRNNNSNSKFVILP
ncbi:hypothetical protein QO200_05500 [Flavobacterium sp. Arc3]|uniref:hypothetical protein n=1 Tax=Flavobacterium sp. Arc3 TaxID=3046686 RepID=UPI00352F6F64